MAIAKLEKQYLIRSYEGDQNNNLRLVTCMNILQDAATTDADRRGFGMEFCQKHNMTWVGNDYVIEIARLPKIGENIKVVTWPSLSGKLAARRDFAIYDEKGELIIKSASRWLLISLDKKRPLAISEILQNYEPVEEYILETNFDKIAEVDEQAKMYQYRVRYDDIDINNHVNNAVYPLWASESISSDYRLSHTPVEIELCFKKEARAGILKDVILWGITDRMSWKNNFPVPGRTDAPLLFDGEGNPKSAFDKLCK